MTMNVFTLANAQGMEVRFIAFGGRIVSIVVPDRRGKRADVTPGYDSLDAYRADGRYLGALVGRYANRIAHGRFTLDGVTYQLPLNDGENHLHGGPCGFHHVDWRVAPFRSERGMGAVLCYRSPDGDEGYPGTLTARTTYTLNDDNTLIVDYSAIADAPTPVNLTQHMYLNLAGHDAGDILDHELTLDALYITPVDDQLIPTGALRGVHGTPFDFNAPSTIGARIAADDEQVRIAGGFDHNFMVRRAATAEPRFAARLYEPRSGRMMELFTTEPGLQFYTGNTLDRGAPGKDGAIYRRHGALALEPQHFPDSPNQPHFPSTILRPGGEYRSRSIYRFSTRAAPPPARP